MKNFGFLTTLLFGGILLAGCTTTHEEPQVIDDCILPGECSEEPVALDEEDSHSLILVFSPTGNTKRIASYISELTDNDYLEILPEELYTEEDLNWRNEDSRTFQEYKNPDIRPEIQTEIDIDSYNTIYLGYPIWFGITPNIILTLLERYDFSAKNIILFCTSEHVGIEKSVEYFQPYGLNILGSKRFAQDATIEEVQEWIETL